MPAVVEAPTMGLMRVSTDSVSAAASAAAELLAACNGDKIVCSDGSNLGARLNAPPRRGFSVGKYELFSLYHGTHVAIFHEPYD